MPHSTRADGAELESFFLYYDARRGAFNQTDAKTIPVSNVPVHPKWDLLERSRKGFEIEPLRNMSPSSTENRKPH